jgi:hypothetical protein
MENLLKECLEKREVLNTEIETWKFMLTKLDKHSRQYNTASAQLWKKKRLLKLLNNKINSLT